MKIKSFYSILTIVALLINSCGNNNKDASIKSNSTFSSEHNEEVSITSSAGSKNWNKILDSYESYATKYISLLKKAMAGDMSEMSEYTSLMEKATELENRLQNAGEDLSDAQMTRFVKIQTKLLESASESMGSTFGSMDKALESLEEDSKKDEL